jgi:hypothetical protein
VGSFGTPLGKSTTLTRGLEQFGMGSAVGLSHLSLIPRCAETIPFRLRVISTWSRHVRLQLQRRSAQDVEEL